MTGGFVPFTVAISRLNKLVQKIKAEGMRLFDLKGVHTLCLYQLMEQPEGMSFNEIAESCDLDRALVSRMLKELQEKGLIRKDGEPGKYKAAYFLTEKARGWVTEICKIVEHAQAFVDVGVSQEDLAIFYKVLGQLTENFEKLAREPDQIFRKEKLEMKLKEEKRIMSIRIITDSASDIINCDREDLTVLPLSVHFEEEEYQDGVNLSHEEFYEKLIESDTLPKTSQVPPYAFEEAYEKAKEAGEEVLVLTLASKLSGTCQSACIARDGYEDMVTIVDTENAAIGEHALVEYAFRLKDQGLSVKEIAEILEREKKNLKLVALLDTLEYLKKGGRISAVAAVAGGLLNIKPVITLKDGEIQVLGKARGSKQGNNFLVEQIHAAGGIDFEKPLFLAYSGLSDKLLQKYIKDSEALWKCGTDHLEICTIGGTIGTHAGPGAIAVAFFAK